MYTKSTLFLLLLLSLVAAPATWAQSKEMEHAAEALEEVAEKLSDKTGDIAEAIENAMEENSAELEEWAERYSEQWERWAERFEKRFNRWAEEQEDMWDDWAEEYGERWENWADKLEDENIDGEELSRLIQGNLEMLGEMPLGQMVEGLMKEGSEGFESAPWESLQDLQGMLQDAIKNSVDEVERRVERGEEELARMVQRRTRQMDVEQAEQETEIEFILPVIENQQQGLKAKRRILDNEAKNALNKIEDLIQNDDIDADELKAMLKKIVSTSKERARSGKEILKQRMQANEKANQKANARRAKAKEMRAKAQKKREETLRAHERAVANARAIRSDKAKASLKRTLDKMEEGDSPVAEIYKALRSEEAKLMQKSDKLEQLEKEIMKLRKEVEKMKSDKE